MTRRNYNWYENKTWSQDEKATPNNYNMYIDQTFYNISNFDKRFCYGKEQINSELSLLYTNNSNFK